MLFIETIVYFVFVILHNNSKNTKQKQKEMENKKMTMQADRDNDLKRWWNSVPIGQAKEVRNQIIERCKISPFVWGNWINGRTQVPELAKPIINEIAGKNIYDL